ncbi:MAG: L,D-transpeptidase family protein [Flavisolibacter sp.]
MKQMIIAIAAACLLSSCTQVAGWFGSNDDSTNTASDSSAYAAWARDESITEANAYSDLFLDSAAIENYVQKEKLSDSAAKALRNFYLVRNYQYAWFTSSGLTEQARGVWNLYAEDSAHTDKKLREHVDSLVQNDSLTIVKGDSSFVQTELALTKELVQFAQEHTNGLITSSNFYYLVPAKKQDPLQLADSILNKEKDSAQYANNKAYSLLKQQLGIYYKAAKDSGWKEISMRSEKLSKGSTSPVVLEIKKRLQATSDYTTSDTSSLYNDSLVAAIKDYQQRNGLAATGIVNDSLIANLNVPAEERVQQILVNMNRMLWMQPMQDSNRIVVNIPSLMLYAYEDSGKVFQMPVIVGKEGTSTMMFTGDIDQVVFNPVWHVPQSIVKNDIMPKIKTDPSYLKKNNMEITGRNDSIPEIRQLSGKNNALGQVKFLFPNSYDIYLHDTPDKTLFAKKDRALSHGCIRVADAQKLAQYLLRDQKEWTPEKINSVIKADKEQSVTVKNPEPVYITYNTAWVDENGKLNFRNDIYGHDKETMERMFKKAG